MAEKFRILEPILHLPNARFSLKKAARFLLKRFCEPSAYDLKQKGAFAAQALLCFINFRF
jgi:hypothetical protein